MANVALFIWPASFLYLYSSSARVLTLVSADFQNVAQQFVAFYYNTFDTDRTQLQSLYRHLWTVTFAQCNWMAQRRRQTNDNERGREAAFGHALGPDKVDTHLLTNRRNQRDNSMLTFESSSVLGAVAIVEKLKNLPFQRVKHVTSTLDPQPTVGDGVIVLVTGQLQVDDEERPMNFTQVFHLAKDGANYFVYNDVFKLIFG
ncbi:nuclear transport factor 2 [Sporothrix schenckii 1099-18]|uniref:Nuclear transport factor 2 n=1 Tax=Sporothrix schenckii 1099-18 TaxID=1397361 RepID=A0A0F2LVB6_SPOSC|nr:nuclear transport factor 2 [Sporothrix schenckii 1099-18]KJR79836.1 nuclear transport factor 2 [Sporothrix schenckii 1099-18]